MTFVLTAANGDVVLMRGDDGHGTGPTTGAATLRIVGGTGRFQGATGLIQWTGTTAIAPPTLEPNPYTDVFEGTISFNEKWEANLRQRTLKVMGSASGSAPRSVRVMRGTGTPLHGLIVVEMATHPARFDASCSWPVASGSLAKTLRLATGLAGTNSHVLAAPNALSLSIGRYALSGLLLDHAQSGS